MCVSPFIFLIFLYNFKQIIIFLSKSVYIFLNVFFISYFLAQIYYTHIEICIWLFNILCKMCHEYDASKM